MFNRYVTYMHVVTNLLNMTVHQALPPSINQMTILIHGLWMKATSWRCSSQIPGKISILIV